MDTETMEITRTERLDLDPVERGRTTAMMSADGNTLFVGVGGEAVIRVAIDSLETLGHWSLPGNVTGLALSEDGARLYAALGDHVAIVDAGTGDALSTFSFGRTESILHVATP